MNVLDELLWACPLVTLSFRGLGGSGIDRRFIVEAVQIAARLLEVFDPFLWLLFLAAIKS